MRLESEKSGEIEVFSEAQLREALADDRIGRGFVILMHTPQVYIQAGEESGDEYQLEYRDGDAEHHFEADGNYTRDDIRRVFCWYLNNDARWRTEIQWTKREYKPWWKIW